LGKLKQQPRKPRIIKTNITLIEQSRKNKHDKNKIEYNRLRNLINRQAKNDKEECLGQYCEKNKNQIDRENAETSYNFIRNLFGKTKIKSTIIESKERKTLIEDKEIADRWRQYIEELYNDSEKFEELEREREITPKNRVQQ
jgi:hypothetical protein